MRRPSSAPRQPRGSQPPQLLHDSRARSDRPARSTRDRQPPEAQPPAPRLQRLELQQRHGPQQFSRRDQIRASTSRALFRLHVVTAESRAAVSPFRMMQRQPSPRPSRVELAHERTRRAPPTDRLERAPLPPRRPHVDVLTCAAQPQPRRSRRLVARQHATRPRAAPNLANAAARRFQPRRQAQALQPQRVGCGNLRRPQGPDAPAASRSCQAFET